MTKTLNRAASAAILIAVSSPLLFAAEAPVEQNVIAKVLPWVGAPSTQRPLKFMLHETNTIVSIGDSITAAGGYLRDVDATLAVLYPKLKIPAIVNVGISGQKAEDLVGRFQQDVVNRKPTVVTLSIGINDVWHRLGAPHDENVLKAYKENIEKMVDMAQAADIKVILLAPTLITEDVAADGNARLVAYVDAMKAIAKEKKCGLADLHGMFREALKHKPADVTGDWLTSDGVHMNPLGDAIMAVGVLRGLGVPDKDLAKLK